MPGLGTVGRGGPPIQCLDGFVFQSLVGRNYCCYVSRGDGVVREVELSVLTPSLLTSLDRSILEPFLIGSPNESCCRFAFVPVSVVEALERRHNCVTSQRYRAKEKPPGDRFRGRLF